MPADVDLRPQWLVYVVEKRPIAGLGQDHFWVG